MASHPRYDALRGEVDKVLKQRNALLKGAGGRLDADAAFTLDVWDAKLAESGGRAGRGAPGPPRAARRRCWRDTYDAVANRPAEVTAAYVADWAGVGLAAALAASRAGRPAARACPPSAPTATTSTCAIGGMPARTHASQGEQRSLALALRLASHHVVTEVTGSAPVLLLDDVFSELDPDRSDALLANLPAGQTLLTSASGLPPKASPDLVLGCATVASRRSPDRDTTRSTSTVPSQLATGGCTGARPPRRWPDAHPPAAR